jgi:hypothetical protein
MTAFRISLCRPTISLRPSLWLCSQANAGPIPHVGRSSCFPPPGSWEGSHPPDLTWLIFMALGGLVAAQLRPPGSAVITLAAQLGLFKGFANGSAMGAAGAGIAWLIGVVTTVFVVIVLVAAAVVAVRWPTAKIAVRVLGSWTTATGMLMLGWSLR